MSVRLCCQNGRTDRDADWGVESGAWAKETTYYMRIDITTGRGNFKGPGRDYSIINHLYVIEFPRTMYVPQTAMILLLSTEGVNCPKTIFGHKWAFSSQTRKILKNDIYFSCGWFQQIHDGGRPPSWKSKNRVCVPPQMAGVTFEFASMKKNYRLRSGLSADFFDHLFPGHIAPPASTSATCGIGRYFHINFDWRRDVA